MIPLLIAAGVGAAASAAGAAGLAASRDRSSGGGAFGGWVDSKGNPVPSVGLGVWTGSDLLSKRIYLLGGGGWDE